MDLPMSSNIPAIRAENLGKYYSIYAQPQDRLKQSILPRFQRLIGRRPKKYFHEFWALKNVSFEVNRGETVGIIGRNGSGKSTLLQLICGTLTPTTGSIYTEGRIAALLELGSGFNPEFSGRENVYLNGAILGLSQDEITDRFDDIAAFADIGEFIEQPVNMYSSGMYIRLAFAINIMSQPDILIVDEALAVGDMNFQARCMTAMRRRQDAGTTILFVSHDIGTVKSLCSRGVYLEHGEIKAFGKASDVAQHYLRVMREEMNAEQSTSSPLNKAIRAAMKTIEAQPPSLMAGKVPGVLPHLMQKFEHRAAQFRYGSGEARILHADLVDDEDQPLTLVEFDQRVKIRIYLQALQDIKDLSVNFNLADDKKNNITGANLSTAAHPFIQAEAGKTYRVDYSLTLPLLEGGYSISTLLTYSPFLEGNPHFVDVVEDAIIFSVSRRQEGKLWWRVYLFPEVEVESYDD
jgi:lipopolysaccharide transport system ATP-binding protein